MSPKKVDKIKTKKSTKPEEVDELNIFIEKKKIQNEALKKIIDKLNSNEDHTTNK